MTARGAAKLGVMAVLTVAACQGPAAPPSAPTAPSAPPAAPSAAPSVAPAPPPAIRFVDATRSAGIDFTRRTGASGRMFYVEQHGGGAAFVDVDGDGFADLFTVDGGVLPGYSGPAPGGNGLFLNRRDGTFRDATVEWLPKALGYGMGVAVADADADGRPDVFVLNQGSIQVLHNTGSRFEDATTRSGIKGPGWNAGATFADLDGDGLLDMYVVRYVRWSPSSNPHCQYRGIPFACTPQSFEPEADRLFLGRPGGRFEDVGAKWGLASVGRGLGVIAGDVDGDGRPEIYVSNDEDPNFLLRTKPGGGLVDQGLATGAAVNANGLVQAGMGIDMGDYDGDGRQDIVVTNFQTEGVALHRNEGPMRLDDRADTAGLVPATTRSLGFGVVLADFDNDGCPDLFVANGHVWSNVDKLQPAVRHAQANQIFRNRCDGTFEEVGAVWGDAFKAEDVSRGAVAVDYDHDGDLDLFYVNLDAPSVLLRNDGGNTNAWVELRLSEAGGNAEAIGATVTVTAGGRRQVQEVRRCRSFASATEPTLHFGLGAAERVDTVEVRWPDGHTSRAERLAARKRYTWRAGDARPVEGLTEGASQNAR